jgi:hypothetical protein
MTRSSAQKALDDSIAALQQEQKELEAKKKEAITADWMKERELRHALEAEKERLQEELIHEAIQKYPQALADFKNALCEIISDMKIYIDIDDSLHYPSPFAVGALEDMTILCKKIKDYRDARPAPGSITAEQQINFDNLHQATVQDNIAYAKSLFRGRVNVPKIREASTRLTMLEAYVNHPLNIENVAALTQETQKIKELKNSEVRDYFYPNLRILAPVAVGIACIALFAFAFATWPVTQGLALIPIIPFVAYLVCMLGVDPYQSSKPSLYEKYRGSPAQLHKNMNRFMLNTNISDKSKKTDKPGVELTTFKDASSEKIREEKAQEDVVSSRSHKHTKSK